MADFQPKKPGPGQIIDVAWPGRSRPSPTTKAVIVNNYPLVRDPMVVAAPANQPTHVQRALPVVPDPMPISPQPAMDPVVPITRHVVPDETTVPAAPPARRHRLRTILFVAFGLIVLVVLLDLAVARGLVHIAGFKPLTYFFNH